MTLLAAVLAASMAPDDCPNARTQAAMNRCSDAAFRRADAIMTRRWGDAFAYMKDRDTRDSSRGGGFGFAAALLESQRAWLRFRDTQCAIEAGRFVGGSAHPASLAQCRTRLTDARTEQLGRLMWRG